MEHPTRMDNDWGYPYFRKPPYDTVEKLPAREFLLFQIHQIELPGRHAKRNQFVLGVKEGTGPDRMRYRLQQMASMEQCGQMHQCELDQRNMVMG